jgi:hypothetical protein
MAVFSLRSLQSFPKTLQTGAMFLGIQKTHIWMNVLAVPRIIIESFVGDIHVRVRNRTNDQRTNDQRTNVLLRSTQFQY